MKNDRQKHKKWMERLRQESRSRVQQVKNQMKRDRKPSKTNNKKKHVKAKIKTPV